MNRLSLLAVFFLAAAVSGYSLTGAKNEQTGRFFLYKVKPKNSQDVDNLFRPNSAYGENPPIWIQTVSIGKNNYVLIEESKVPVFDKVLTTYSVKYEPKGITLVDSVSAHAPVPRGPRGPECDCDYKSSGCIISKPPPAGYACKCAYKGFRMCSGDAVSCDSNQRCPASCSSLQCCRTGGGNCRGY